MPKREDIKCILLIGSGPIVIGQACEFDYSGTQACKALREEGYRIVLANSNPATIMTDPEMSDATYIEPLTAEYLEKIIEKEKPDVVLPTLGGQTALNLTLELHDKGILAKHNVEVIGANIDAIMKAEQRSLFKEAMEKIGLDVPQNMIVNNISQYDEVMKKIGLPAIIRPSYTLGGIGGGIARTPEELSRQMARGLQASNTSEIIVEEYLNGWKEYELEVMRDYKDNVVIICSIENFDPMGVHTGDSITVAPSQTLSDKQYQEMRDMAIAIIREIGVETGGSNIQFTVNPENGKVKIIEMNPRVSRSSALASKATGFPIAKLAAKLAIGYSLDELNNDITQKTPACFEPSIDYVVTKIPRFAFEKFPQAEDKLTSQMKSVGETMAIGRTFKESFQKALRGLEIGCSGFGLDKKFAEYDNKSKEEVLKALEFPSSERVMYIHSAMRHGIGMDELYKITGGIDKWFLFNLHQLIEMEDKLTGFNGSDEERKEILRAAKRWGYSDRQIASTWDMDHFEVRDMRKKMGILPTYKVVDTCAAEFESYTPYYYSTYELENEVEPTKSKKVAIIGGGPNRIGQGIEFDYCCVHASMALQECGYESIMINSNPETVSTDYDISDRLYFEPVTLEDVLNICDLESPDGVIVQFGGQTPLNLALDLKKAGVKIIGTPPEQIDAAGNREIFKQIVKELELNQPVNSSATSLEEAIQEAEKVTYPVVVRPSFVLGGRAMEIVYDESSLKTYFAEAVKASPDAPVLIDHFLERAIEVDVDCIRDGKNTVIGAIMEHIEEAGIHSGDSACAIPSFRLSDGVRDELRRITIALANRLDVIGLMNVQYAIKGEKVYLIEVNPRASRTIPFVSKTIIRPLAKLATKVMLGKSLDELGFTEEVVPKQTTIKEVVLPFARFTGSDILLSPEMKSTGEVMGISDDFANAYAKSQTATGSPLPREGSIYISVARKDREHIAPIAKQLSDMGFKIFGTAGTVNHLETVGVKATALKKIQEGEPNVLQFMEDGSLHMIIMTASDEKGDHEVRVRQIALLYELPIFTTISGAQAAAKAIAERQEIEHQVRSVQEIASV